MSTTYDATPSLFERVVGSDLILLGVASGPVRVERLDSGERPRVYGWFEMRPERVLDGEPPSSTILMRVIGEGTEDDARWLVPVSGETPVLAMLTRDIGPDLPENLFAPCFAGVYEVSADGGVRVPDDALDRVTRELAGSDGDGLTVDQVHRLVEGVNQRRAEDRRRLEDEEPADVRGLPRPDVQEYPRSAREAEEPTSGGGQDARLE